MLAASTHLMGHPAPDIVQASKNRLMPERHALPGLYGFARRCAKATNPSRAELLVNQAHPFGRRSLEDVEAEPVHDVGTASSLGRKPGGRR